jgi:DNA gyrase subunit A
MRFKLDSDFLQVIEVVDHEAKLLVASEAGLGVRTRFEDYRLINRGGSGVWAIDLPEDGSVKLAGALAVREEDEVMLLTAKGQSIRCPVKDIRETGRGAKGVRLVTLEPGDKLLSIARIVETDEQQAAVAEAPETPTA